MLFLATWLFGQQMWEGIHSYQNKALYQQMAGDDRNIYNLANGKNNDDSENNRFLLATNGEQKGITEFNQVIIENSKTIYGFELNNDPSNFEDYQKFLNGMKDRKMISGESTYLSMYLGELIRNNSQGRWAYDKKRSSYVLVNEEKRQAIDITNYVYNWNFEDGEKVADFYQSSIDKLGAK